MNTHITRGARTFALTRVRNLPIADRWLFAALLIGTGLASWQSYRVLLPYARGDTPLSFVPLVPLVGAFFLWRRFDPADIRSRTHDPFVDGLFLSLLIAASCVFLLLLPVTMSWDYWLDRLDVPGIVIVLCTVTVAAWGLPGLIKLSPALLYLLLAWPLPYLLLDNRFIPAMTSVTAAATRFVAPLLHLGIRPDPADPASLLVTFHGHTAQLVIAQACAGINGAVGLVVIALPIVWLARGSWESRVGWLLAGAALSWLMNVVRIVAIAAVTAIWGPGPTMTFLHPVFGLFLFALSFVVLLFIAPLFRLNITASWEPTQKTGSSGAVSAPRWNWRRLGLLLFIVGGAALAESNLGQFGWLTESSLPRVGLATASDLFHPPAGWHVTAAQRVLGWEPLFGPSTVSSVMTIRTARQADVDVQAIITRDASSFGAYGVEECYTFHGFVLHSVQRVSLGNGVTGTLVDFQDGNRTAASLYWLQPVSTPNGLYHQRIVLITGFGSHAARLAVSGSTPPAPGVVQPVQHVAEAIANFLSPWVGGSAGPAYTGYNAELQNLGQAVIAHERQATS